MAKILPAIMDDDLKARLNKTREQLDSAREDNSAMSDRDALLLIADILLMGVEAQCHHANR